MELLLKRDLIFWKVLWIVLPLFPIRSQTLSQLNLWFQFSSLQMKKYQYQTVTTQMKTFEVVLTTENFRNLLFSTLNGFLVALFIWGENTDDICSGAGAICTYKVNVFIYQKKVISVYMSIEHCGLVTLACWSTFAHLWNEFLNRQMALTYTIILQNWTAFIWKQSMKLMLSDLTW